MPLLIVKDDIGTMQCDAVVNISNGNSISPCDSREKISESSKTLSVKECKSIFSSETNSAKIVKSHNHNSKYTIYVSVSKRKGGDYSEKELLKSTYLESLNLAKKHKCETIAFPLTFFETCGCPREQILPYAAKITEKFIFDNEITVYLCISDKKSYEFDKKLFNEINKFISPPVENRRLCAVGRETYAKKIINYGIMTPEPICEMSLNDYLKSMDKPFTATLFDYIDKKGLTDVECYKKANIDRKTFSKIRSNPNHRPSKQTAVAFAIALKLTFSETQHLLSTAGLTLSNSNKFDMIIKYFIENGNYNIHEVNQALFEFDQVLLGSL